MIEVVIVEPSLLPAGMLRLDGLAPSEKSDGPVVPQPGSLNVPIRVCQLKLPLVDRYSLVYQKVQLSLGSTLMLV